MNFLACANMCVLTAHTVVASRMAVLIILSSIHPMMVMSFHIFRPDRLHEARFFNNNRRGQTLFKMADDKQRKLMISDTTKKATQNHSIIHFNNAGCSPMPPTVYETVCNHLKLETEIGGYLAADVRQEDIQSVYTSIAQLLNCDANEIALVESATVAWTRAFYSICDSHLEAGDVMVCCQLEYAAVVVAMQKIATERGYRVILAPSLDDGSGAVDVSSFQKLLYEEKRIALVCMVHIPTNCGIVNPVERIGDIISEMNLAAASASGRGENRKRVLYLVDACQSVGQRVVDVQKVKCDALACTGRKYLRGPRGTGFLFVRKELLASVAPCHIDHAGAPISFVPKSPLPSKVEFEYQDGAKRFEFWEASIANQLGLGAAVDYCLSVGIEDIQSRCTELGQNLGEAIRVIDGIHAYHYSEDPEKLSGIVVFGVENLSSTEIKEKMLAKGFTLSVVPATSTPFDSSITKCPDLVRASVSYFNTFEEVSAFCSALGNIVNDHR